MQLLKRCYFAGLGVLLSMCLLNCSSLKSTVHADSKQTVFIEQPLKIVNGDYKIPGILVTPNLPASQKIPVVIMLHDTGSQKNEVGNLYQRLAIYLAAKGYASLRIDFAGSGDSSLDYRFYNLVSAQGDATTALNFLSSQKQFDSNRIGIIGFGQGGLIAQLVAAEDPRIKAIVTWSSMGGNGIDIFKPLFDKYYAEAQKNGFAVVKFTDSEQSLEVGLKWFNDIKNNISLARMSNYKGKLLAIAGDADTLVPNQVSSEIVKTSGSSDAKLEIIKGADHSFNVLDKSAAKGLAEDQSTAENMLAITTDWLRLKL